MFDNVVTFIFFARCVRYEHIEVNIVDNIIILFNKSIQCGFVLILNIRNIIRGVRCHGFRSKFNKSLENIFESATLITTAHLKL